MEIKQQQRPYHKEFLFDDNRASFVEFESLDFVDGDRISYITISDGYENFLNFEIKQADTEDIDCLIACLEDFKKWHKNRERVN